MEDYFFSNSLMYQLRQEGVSQIGKTHHPDQIKIL